MRPSPFEILQREYSSGFFFGGGGEGLGLGATTFFGGTKLSSGVNCPGLEQAESVTTRERVKKCLVSILRQS